MKLSRHLLQVTFIAFFSLSVLPAHADEVLAKGKHLYSYCLPCHKAQGQGNQEAKAPAIAGQEKWYLELQLKNFKHNIRANDPRDIEGLLMKPMALTLPDDKAIEAVATYVSKMKKIKPKKTLEGGDPVAGKTKYIACAACHGDKGQGGPEALPTKGPNLQNLPDWYFLSTIHKFKKGIRGGPKDTPNAKMMAGMAMSLVTDQDIKDVIAFIQSNAK